MSTRHKKEKRILDESYAAVLGIDKELVRYIDKSGFKKVFGNKLMGMTPKQRASYLSGDIGYDLYRASAASTKRAMSNPQPVGRGRYNKLRDYGYTIGAILEQENTELSNAQIDLLFRLRDHLKEEQRYLGYLGNAKDVNKGIQLDEKTTERIEKLFKGEMAKFKFKFGTDEATKAYRDKVQGAKEDLKKTYLTLWEESVAKATLSNPFTKYERSQLKEKYDEESAKMFEGYTEEQRLLLLLTFGTKTDFEHMTQEMFGKAVELLDGLGFDRDARKELFSY